MIKTIVCDDNKQTAEKIKSYVNEIFKSFKINAEIFTYYSGKEILELICHKKYQFDLLLLDIDMPDITGLDVAKTIRQTNSNIILIFISSHEQYVFKSIEYRPFRYIRKEYLKEELPNALKAAYKLIESDKDESIIIKVNDEDVRLKHSEIMYYEIESRKLAIHLNNNDILRIRKTIRDFNKELADKNYIQINSGCVANAKYIEKISNADITLDNGKKLIVSRTRMKAVKSELLEYWGDRV